MQVIISNRLDILADRLKAALFSQLRHPFHKKWVIVPHQRIQEELAFRWASDPDLQIATGFHFLTWKEALFQLFPKIPSLLELSLRIESRLGHFEELKPYLQQGGAARKASLAETLATLFLKYVEVAEEKLLEWLKKPGWQQMVWQEVFGGDLPWPNPQLLPGEVFLFNPAGLTGYQHAAFASMQTQLFLFSPCAMYWGDLKTAQQQQFLLQKNQNLQGYFSQDHPLLANWGRAGQDLMRRLEDEEWIEAYEELPGESLLVSLQHEILSLSTVDKQSDASIQVHAAHSQLHEVELVAQVIQRLPCEPRDIVVYAPNIQEYAPFIEMVFRTTEQMPEFAIFGLEAKTKNRLMQGMQDFLDLVRTRFSKEAMQKLLFSLGFDPEDLQQIDAWIGQVQIRYDLKGNHPNTWEAGLKRLVEALVLPQESHLAIEMSQVDLLSRLIEIVSTLQQIDVSQERPLQEWIELLKAWMKSLLNANPDDELLRKLDPFTRMTDRFPFSTVERILHTLFKAPSGAIHGAHLQAVKFSSFQPGILTAAKVVILMGMDEGSFPSKDLPTSLQQLTPIPRADSDRYLFLQALFSAQETLIITYPCLHPEDGKPQKASPCVEELCHYAHVTPAKSSRPRRPWPSLTSQEIPHVPAAPPTSWDISALRRLARHPLQFFFQERFEMEFEWKELSSEFVLPALDLAKLRRESLKTPLEKLIPQLQEAGKLPVGPFGEIARKKICEEIEDYHAQLAKLNIDSSEIFSIELRLDCPAKTQVDDHTWIYPALVIPALGCTVQGKITDLTSQGLLFHGDETISDLLKIWPIYLSVRALHPDLPLLLSKKGKVSRVIPSESCLERYLRYAQKALSTPSPLLPKWGRAILTENKIPLFAEDDPVIKWMQTRQLMPSSGPWLDQWKSDLQETFCEIL